MTASYMYEQFPSVRSFQTLGEGGTFYGNPNGGDEECHFFLAGYRAYVRHSAFGQTTYFWWEIARESHC